MTSESASTRRRYALLTEYLVTRHPWKLISFITTLGNRQIENLLSPRGELIIELGKSGAVAYHIFQKKKLLKPDCEIHTEIEVDGYKEGIEVIPSPVVSLRMASEIIKQERLLKRMVYGLLKDLSDWYASNKNDKLSIEIVIINYAEEIEDSFGMQISSHRIRNHIDNTLNLLMSMDDLRKSIHAEFPAVNYKNVWLWQLIEQFIKEQEQAKRNKLRKKGDKPDYTIDSLCRELNINASTFHHQIEWRKILHPLKNCNGNICTVRTEELIRLYRLNKKDPHKDKADLIKMLGGRVILVHLKPTLMAKVRKIS